MANKPGFFQKAWNTITTIPTGAYNLGRKAYQLGQSVGKPSAPARKPAGPPIAPARKPATPPAQKSPYSQKGYYSGMSKENFGQYYNMLGYADMMTQAERTKKANPYFIGVNADQQNKIRNYRDMFAKNEQDFIKGLAKTYMEQEALKYYNRTGQNLRQLERDPKTGQLRLAVDSKTGKVWTPYTATSKPTRYGPAFNYQAGAWLEPKAADNVYRGQVKNDPIRQIPAIIAPLTAQPVFDAYLGAAKEIGEQGSKVFTKKGIAEVGKAAFKGLTAVGDAANKPYSIPQFTRGEDVVNAFGWQKTGDWYNDIPRAILGYALEMPDVAASAVNPVAGAAKIGARAAGRGVVNVGKGISKIGTPNSPIPMLNNQRGSVNFSGTLPTSPRQAPDTGATGGSSVRPDVVQTVARVNEIAKPVRVGSSVKVINVPDLVKGLDPKQGNALVKELENLGVISKPDSSGKSRVVILDSIEKTNGQIARLQKNLGEGNVNEELQRLIDRRATLQNLVGQTPKAGQKPVVTGGVEPAQEVPNANVDSNAIGQSVLAKRGKVNEATLKAENPDLTPEQIQQIIKDLQDARVITKSGTASKRAVKSSKPVTPVVKGPEAPAPVVSLTRSQRNSQAIQNQLNNLDPETRAELAKFIKIGTKQKPPIVASKPPLNNVMPNVPLVSNGMPNDIGALVRPTPNTAPNASNLYMPMPAGTSSPYTPTGDLLQQYLQVQRARNAQQGAMPATPTGMVDASGSTSIVPVSGRVSSYNPQIPTYDKNGNRLGGYNTPFNVTREPSSSPIVTQNQSLIESDPAILQGVNAIQRSIDEDSSLNNLTDKLSVILSRESEFPDFANYTTTVKQQILRNLEKEGITIKDMPKTGDSYNSDMFESIGSVNPEVPTRNAQDVVIEEVKAPSFVKTDQEYLALKNKKDSIPPNTDPVVVQAINKKMSKIAEPYVKQGFSIQPDGTFVKRGQVVTRTIPNNTVPPKNVANIPKYTIPDPTAPPTTSRNTNIAPPVAFDKNTFDRMDAISTKKAEIDVEMQQLADREVSLQNRILDNRDLDLDQRAKINIEELGRQLTKIRTRRAELQMEKDNLDQGFVSQSNYSDNQLLEQSRKNYVDATSEKRSMFKTEEDASLAQKFKNLSNLQKLGLYGGGAVAASGVALAALLGGNSNEPTSAPTTPSQADLQQQAAEAQMKKDAQDAVGSNTPTDTSVVPDNILSETERMLQERALAEQQMAEAQAYIDSLLSGGGGGLSQADMNMLASLGMPVQNDQALMDSLTAEAQAQAQALQQSYDSRLASMQSLQSADIGALRQNEEEAQRRLQDDMFQRYMQTQENMNARGLLSSGLMSDAATRLDMTRQDAMTSLANQTRQGINEVNRYYQPMMGEVLAGRQAVSADQILRGLTNEAQAARTQQYQAAMSYMQMLMQQQNADRNYQLEAAKLGLQNMGTGIQKGDIKGAQIQANQLMKYAQSLKESAKDPNNPNAQKDAVLAKNYEDLANTVISQQRIFSSEEMQGFINNANYVAPQKTFTPTTIEDANALSASQKWYQDLPTLQKRAVDYTTSYAPTAFNMIKNANGQIPITAEQYDLIQTLATKGLSGLPVSQRVGPALSNVVQAGFTGVDSLDTAKQLYELFKKNPSVLRFPKN